MRTTGQRYTFKPAETDAELEQIHRLNYRTFVREIPQHGDPGSGRLVDKFHGKNQYFIALSGERVIAMVSVHDRPPFSAAEKIPDPQVLEKPGMRPLEVRLLAIEPSARLGKIFAGLLWQVQEHARARGHTHLLISGLAERESLYLRMGFSRLGPPVGSGTARFIPMIAEIEKFPHKIKRSIEHWRRYFLSLDGRTNGRTGDRANGRKNGRSKGNGRKLVRLSPGPVMLSPEVRRAFAEPPLSHRGPEFLEVFQGVRRALSDLVGGAEVALFAGSGTLANDVVAAALSGRRRRGLVLVNGEFGERLLAHASGAGLEFQALRWAWGRPWDLGQVEEALAADPPPGWVWGVHLESSTGVLNDRRGLVQAAARRGALVALDTVSSLGAVALDLGGVHLATGVTGKSLGACAGVGIVFAAPGAAGGIDSRRVPPALDLEGALAAEGTRFTFPSPPLLALQAALARYSPPAGAARVYERYAALGRFVRGNLRRLGLSPLTGEDWASPVITTFEPPGDQSSPEFLDRCRAWGFELGGLSGYLRERRLVQIATMGEVSEEDCARLFEKLER